MNASPQRHIQPRAPKPVLTWQNQWATRKGITLLSVIFLALASVATYGYYHNDNQLTVSPPTYAAAAVQSTAAITANGFTPSAASIRPGTQFIWVNNDSKSHQLAADTSYKPIPGFGAAKVLLPGETYMFTFEAPGTYYLYDQLDTHNQYHLTVTVQ